MNELEMSRDEITKIDEKMAKLFEARMKAAAKIAEYKRRTVCPSGTKPERWNLSTVTVNTLRVQMLRIPMSAS